MYSPKAIILITNNVIRTKKIISDSTVGSATSTGQNILCKVMSPSNFV